MAKRINYVGKVMSSEGSGDFEVLRSTGRKHVVRFINTSNVKEVYTESMKEGTIIDSGKHEGKLMESKNFGDFKVLQFLGGRKHLIRFINTGNELEVWTSAMLKGTVKDRESPTVYGVGVVGNNRCIMLKDVNGIIEKIVDPYYRKWHGILQRCYDNAWHKKHPTYKDCTVCKDWLNLGNFKSWMFDLGYSYDNLSEWSNLHLDKDLIVERNKVYSPATCMLVEHRVNSFFKLMVNIKRDYPLGVSLNRRSALFKGDCSGYLGGDDLGYFSTEMDTHRAWQLAKINVAEKLTLNQRDKRVIKGLQRVIDKIQYDYDNNLITESY